MNAQYYIDCLRAGRFAEALNCFQALRNTYSFVNVHGGDEVAGLLAYELAKTDVREDDLKHVALLEELIIEDARQYGQEKLPGDFEYNATTLAVVISMRLEIANAGLLKEVRRTEIKSKQDYEGYNKVFFKNHPHIIKFFLKTRTPSSSNDYHYYNNILNGYRAEIKITQENQENYQQRIQILRNKFKQCQELKPIIENYKTCLENKQKKLIEHAMRKGWKYPPTTDCNQVISTQEDPEKRIFQALCTSTDTPMYIQAKAKKLQNRYNAISNLNKSIESNVAIDSFTKAGLQKAIRICKQNKPAWHDSMKFNQYDSDFKNFLSKIWPFFTLKPIRISLRRCFFKPKQETLERKKLESFVKTRGLIAGR